VHVDKLRSTDDFTFQTLLHNYFAVDDVGKISVDGVSDCPGTATN